MASCSRERQPAADASPQLAWCLAMDAFEVAGLCDQRRRIPLTPISLLMLSDLLLVVLLGLAIGLLTLDFSLVGGQPWTFEGMNATACMFVLM